MAIVYWSGPQFKSLQPAYNPMVFTCQDDGATGVPPVVYCDVYFNHEYYKTLSSSTPAAITGSASYWLFDVSGLAQEYIESKVPSITVPNFIGGAIMEEMYLAAIGAVHYGANRCYVKFRISTQDAYTIITPEAPEPIQATFDTAAVAGTGYATDNFQIVNAASQWNTDIADLEQHLNQYRRTGVFSSVGYYVDAAYKVYQLSHLRRGRIYASDYGQMSVLVKRDGFYTGPGGSYTASVVASIAIEMYDVSGARIFAAPSDWLVMNSESIYNLPTGIANLLVLFPAMAGLVKDCHYYQVFIYEDSWGAISRCMYVTPKIYLQQAANVQPSEHVRIWFRNYLGHLDQLNFRVKEEQLKVTSSPTERPEIRRHDSSLVSLKGMGRNNVRSNEQVMVSEVFEEGDMPVVKELMGTAQAYIEVPGKDWVYSGGVSGVPAVLVPITIEDAEYETRKYEGRYEYQVSLKYTMSHENKIIRN